MHFFRLIRASIYSPSFYHSLLTKPYSFSFKYFFLLGTILAVSFSAFFSYSAIPALDRLFRSAGGVLVDHFPEDLVIDVVNGEATVNQPEPYRIQYPEGFQRDERNLPANFLVVDTQSEFSVDRFEDFSTSVLITKRELVWQTTDGQIGIDSLARVPNVRLDQAFVKDLINQFNALGSWLAPAVVFGSFVVFLLVYALQLVYALAGACIAYLIARFRGLGVPYAKAYQMTLHALTLGTLVESALTNGLLGPTVPYLGTFVLAVVLLFNLRWPAPAVVTVPPPAAGTA